MANIIVVEDDENLNRIICSYLSQNNYRVRGCRNAAEAFAALATETCDLIISDIMMPKTDGFEFAKEIRADYPDMPILFVTALDDISSKRKGFNAGVDDYMVKPIEMDLGNKRQQNAYGRGVDACSRGNVGICKR